MTMTSILKKVAMALSGLAMLGFLVMHLAGNFLLLKSAKAFNDYSAMLHSTGVLLYVAEAGLVLFFLVHVVSGVRVSRENRKARQTQYAVKATAGQATLFSRTMALSGLIILVFVPVHIAMFKFGNAGGGGGLWGLVMREFSQPLTAAWYVLAMLAVGMHLSHGVGSAFQTLGILKPTWRKPLRQAGVLLGWALALGFASIPVWALMQAQKV
jgi:succinate dehydrogenase / fumarate reductase cytochrome b subunit